jgi:hypothetical protein
VGGEKGIRPTMRLGDGLTLATLAQAGSGAINMVEIFHQVLLPPQREIAHIQPTRT